MDATGILTDKPNGSLEIWSSCAPYDAWVISLGCANTFLVTPRAISL